MGTKREGIFEMESMQLDNTWKAYTLQEANLYIFQCRDDTNNINVSHHKVGMGYFTIKVRQSLPLSSFALDEAGGTQVLYFRGAATNCVLEILKQKKT